MIKGTYESLEYPRIFQNNFSQEKFHLSKRQENHHHFCSLKSLNSSKPCLSLCSNAYSLNYFSLIMLHYRLVTFVSNGEFWRAIMLKAQGFDSVAPSSAPSNLNAQMNKLKMQPAGNAAAVCFNLISMSVDIRSQL